MEPGKNFDHYASIVVGRRVVESRFGFGSFFDMTIETLDGISPVIWVYMANWVLKNDGTAIADSSIFDPVIAKNALDGHVILKICRSQNLSVSIKLSDGTDLILEPSCDKEDGDSLITIFLSSDDYASLY